MKLQTLPGTTTNVSSHFMHLWDCSTGKWMQNPINLPDAWCNVPGIHLIPQYLVPARRE